MKIAIHHNPGSFSDQWIDFCRDNAIEFKIVDCYSSDIIGQLDNCDILMWHHSHLSYKDVLFAKQLLFSLQLAGKRVFPDFNTGWHFDDKVGQKYLLESIGAPMVPSYVFYDISTAINWINSTDFPKVFKLRGGAGSSNVRLVKDRKHAISLTKKAFGQGFSQFNRIGYLLDRYEKFKNNKDIFLGVLKGIGRLFIPTEFSKMHGREKGYIYFQDFVPNNTFDTRVIIIGERAFGIKRLNRKNDFRASGSGFIVYSKDEIDIRCVSLGLETSAKLKLQCMTYDFVFDNENYPRIVEISYGFSSLAYKNCPGYWDAYLSWHEGKFNPQGWMVELMLKD